MPVIYMDKEAVNDLKEQDIKKIIEKNSSGMKYQKLENYYIGKHQILYNGRKDPALPDNRIVCNTAKYITDTATGYFIGNPVTYSCENEDQMEMYQDIMEYNDEHDENMELAKKGSINGHCFEMLWIDEDAKIRFGLLRPDSAIFIYETGTDNVLAVIRFMDSLDKDGNLSKKAEFWNADCCMKFYAKNKGTYILQEVSDHYWGDVPFVEYMNNEERLGDYESVISMIDAYNKAQSNTANFFEYNDQALLKIKGMGEIRAKDIKEMKEAGGIVLEEAGDIDWLLKEVNDAAIENYKKRLNDDIHNITSVPNMSDDAFGGNVSGIAISYKLWNFEQIRITKERKFKKGLMRRAELITHMLNIMGNNFDYRAIIPHFRSNSPQNLNEIATIINQLDGFISRDSLLQLLPFVQNSSDELEKLEKEEANESESFTNYQRFNELLNEDPKVISDE